MAVLDRINYRGYRINVVSDDDAANPLAEDQFAPTLVLHEKAERRFGWTTDKAWTARLEGALDAIRERGVTKNMYGPGGALAIVTRWLTVAHRMPVVLPVGAMDHSGVAVYLGNGEHPMDPGGWDSGWIGWFFATPETVAEWGLTDLVKIAENVHASFSSSPHGSAGTSSGSRSSLPRATTSSTTATGSTIRTASTSPTAGPWKRPMSSSTPTSRPGKAPRERHPGLPRGDLIDDLGP
jgi:hypothetical protein